MSFTIVKLVSFCASHQLVSMPLDHQCARLHGHNYDVEVELEGERLDPHTGMLVDFGVISGVIKMKFDHRHLNDIPDFDNNPTAERLCCVIRSTLFHANALPNGVHIRRIRVSETPGSWAEWMPTAIEEA